MKAFEYDHDIFLETYLQRWDEEVATPLIKWKSMLSEAKLTNDQVAVLFGDVVDNTQDIKTTAGKVAGVAAKGAKVAAKLLPNNIANKIHELIKDSGPVKNFDAAFENAKTNLVAKLGGDDSKIVQWTTSLAKMAKDHPAIGSAVIGLLTVAAAVGTGGVGGALVGAILKTGNELLKGESLSKSLASGAGAGAVGALAGWGVREIAQWMPGMSFNMSKVPGYTDLVHVKHLHQTNGITDFSLDADMTADAARKMNKLLDTARNSDYLKAAEIYGKIEKIFTNPDYLDTIRQVTGKNKEMYDAALASANKMASFWGGVADAAQGGVTAASNSAEKPVTSESRSLSEADMKGLISSIGDWAKTQASQVTNKFTVDKLNAAWKASGQTLDSDVLHGVLSRAGVPKNVLDSAWTKQSIPLPAASQQDEPATQAVPEIKTGDPAEDAKIKDIYANQGKDAAIAYLKTLLSKTQTPSAPATAPAAAKLEPITLANGVKIMPSDPSYKALADKIAKADATQAEPTQSAEPAPIQAAPAPATPAYDKEAAQKRAAAARSAKPRAVREEEESFETQ